MSNLLKRIFSGLIYIILFIGAILYSQDSFIALISFFAIACIWEFSKLIKLKNPIPYLVFALFVFFMLKHKNSNAVLVLLVTTIISSSQFIYKLYFKKEIKSEKTSSKLFLLIRYVVCSLSFLILIPFLNDIYTPSILIGILILIWTNDSFAFIIGKKIGRRKLFESVSPKKTIEGFIGGFVFAILASYLIAKQTQLFSTLNWLIIGTIISVIGTIGDLVESKFKRQAKIKDSGTVMPGHGGLLDRLDSLLFVAPFVYLYIYYII
jgi:phosphatidate cytidylyltransferase